MRTPSFYNFEANKWEWTQEAIENFNQGFLRFTSFHNLQEQIYIGVYGPTQVGKTTFILTILGIDETKLPKLSKAFRGKRDYGNSATITCTIFKKTNSQHFKIHWPNGEIFQCESLDEVAEVMANLRKVIESSNQYSTSECVIEIPLSYFKESKRFIQARELSIIDLPGDNSKEIREVHHVDRILSHYLRICKVCIILEKANRLVRLTQLPLESVKYWNELPMQFRIILTQSISVNTIYESIISGKITNADQLVNNFHIALDEMLEKGSLKTKIYPLEFGDSWLQIANKSPELFNKVHNWFETIYESLIEDLLATYTPEQEIYKLINLDRYIIEKRDKELSVLKSLIKEESERVSKQRQNLYSHKQQTKEAYERYKDIKNNAKVLSGGQTAFYYEPLKYWDRVTFAQAKVDVLNANFRYEYDKLVKHYNSKIEELLMITHSLNTDLFLTINTKGIRSINARQYFSQVSHKYQQYYIKKNFNNDVATLNAKLDKLKAYLKKSLEEKMKSLDTEFTVAVKMTKFDFKNLQDQKRIMKSNITKQENLINALNEDLKEAIEDWENDIYRSSQLHYFLMDAFVNESNRLKEQLEHPDTAATDRWIIHQYWNEIAYHAKEIISYVAENNPKL